MEDKTTIPLSATQRDLLLKYGSNFLDHKLFRLISVALKKGKNYEIYLDEEQIRSLVGEVHVLSENEGDVGLILQLEEMCDYLLDFSNEFKEDENDSGISSNTGSVCILKVALAYSKEIWRKIAIREGQNLHDLHNFIFDAFDRDDEHLYSFFFPHSAKKFNPRNIYKSSDEYTHPSNYEADSVDGSERQNAAMSTIESLDLTEGRVFYYLFDFGDEWWHEITIENTDGAADEGEYPRTIERNGVSPEQYPDPDEDEDW